MAANIGVPVEHQYGGPMLCNFLNFVFPITWLQCTNPPCTPQSLSSFTFLKQAKQSCYAGENAVLSTIKLLLLLSLLLFSLSYYVSLTIDLDYCDPNPCQHGGTCQQRHGSHECICNEEFKGKVCESEINRQCFYLFTAVDYFKRNWFIRRYFPFTYSVLFNVCRSILN